MTSYSQWEHAACVRWSYVEIVHQHQGDSRRSADEVSAQGPWGLKLRASGGVTCHKPGKSTLISQGDAVSSYQTSRLLAVDLEVAG
jgi:hypothetical protein